VAESLDGVSAPLFERLKLWRRLRAEAEGVPAYVICHDATLAAIAEQRPLSSEDLLTVPGMGPAKLQRYGAQLLAEMKAHYEEHPEAMSAPRPERAPVPPSAIRAAGPAAAPADGPPQFLTRRFSEYQLQVRQEHARAYDRWSDEEDARVVTMHEAGRTPAEICLELQRQPTSIAMRMEKLGLVEPQPAQP
jgi:hypothetical protein